MASVADARAALEWQYHAACLDEDPELFFPERPETEERSAAAQEAYESDVAKAKAVCAACDVRAICRAWALEEIGPGPGIFGGLTEDERQNLLPAHKDAA